jgi:DNA-binding response OmpR family regulator
LPQFLTWLRGRGDRPQGIVYLTQKGMRRGLIGAHGPMVRKPVDRESLARAVRSVGVLLSAGPIPDCYVDLHRGAIVGPAGRVHLTYIETNLLAYLTTHHGKVVSSGKLLTDVWGYATPFGASTLARAHMSNLRAKLVDAGLPDDVILTYRGRGYLCQAEMPLVGNPDAVLR